MGGSIKNLYCPLRIIARMQCCILRLKRKFVAYQLEDWWFDPQLNWANY